MTRAVVLVSSVALLLFGSLAASASAQTSRLPGPPGAPAVEFHADCSATIRFAPATGATSYEIVAKINDVSVGALPIGSEGIVRTPPLPPGRYLIWILAINEFGQTLSPPVGWEHTCGGLPPGGAGPIAAPAWISLSATGTTVSGSFTPVSGATAYEAELTILSTSQVLTIDLGSATSFTSGGAPRGNFLVRVRARNAFGAGPYGQQRLLVIGVILGTGDLQVTLTWNTETDIDLHVIEPDGTHVFYANPTGPTARLDVDDVTGFGPENIFVGRGTARRGIYQVFIVYYAGAPPTLSTIAVQLDPGTGNEQVAIFTRTTTVANPAVGYNVANIDVGARTITETFGRREADERGGAPAKAATAGARH